MDKSSSDPPIAAPSSESMAARGNNSNTHAAGTTVTTTGHSSTVGATTPAPSSSVPGITPPTSTPPILPRVCGSCGKGGAVSRCSKCLSTYYCSQTCQANDWRRHKTMCVKVEPRGTSIPANSAAVAPPSGSSASTRSSVASSTAAAMHSSKEVSIAAPSAVAHSHSHGGMGHGHSHGPSSHGHVHSHSHSHGHAHACGSPTCPHNTGGGSAVVNNMSKPPTGVVPSVARPAGSPSPTAPTANPAASNTTPVHSQTSYSPVPISNVSASSRHIYVPPCRPLLRPSFLHFPSSPTPPLSCIHGFHTNLLFSTEQPVRILYADLGDIRHVMQSLIDLHSKMKAWKKKVNAAGGSGSSSDASKKRKGASELPLPTPPSLASARNPNIGIEFHLNDANPHVLARSVLFLVAAYMSSAVMNRELAENIASGFGISLHPNHVHSSYPSPPTNTNASSPPPPSPPQPTPSSSGASTACLSYYTYWTPSDHWAYLFSLYGSYQIPLQFVRRTRETLELLVRLTGASTIAMEKAAAAAASTSSSSGTPPLRDSSQPLTPQEATLFSQHPYTFFLHLPSLTLSLLLPIWRSWEHACYCAIAAVEGDMGGTPSATAGAAAPETLGPNGAKFHLGPIAPLFTKADVNEAHPSDAPLSQILSDFYQRGSVGFHASHFPLAHVPRSSEELSRIRSKLNPDQAVLDLLPPSAEEYAQADAFLLNPPALPLNVSNSSLSSYSLVLPNSASLANGGGAMNVAAVGENYTKRLTQEVSLKFLFAREPFSMLLPKLSGLSREKDKEKGDKEKEKVDKKEEKKEDGAKREETGVLSAAMELMSKMSHALFWVVQFQQQTNAPIAAPPSTSPQKPVSKVPYVRLYFYNHDLHFHLHTYDFLYDRILVYHMNDYAGMQSLVLMARHRMKNQDSLLECAMNFPSCSTAVATTTCGSNSTATTPTNASSTNGNQAVTVTTVGPSPDLIQYCLHSLNANPKLIRNIFGWEVNIYTYPSPPGSRVALHALRFTVCDYSLDLSAPALPNQPSDGFRVVHDWLLTSIVPILLSDNFSQVLSPLQLQHFQQTVPRSICNIRIFCLLIGLLIKQGHLDSKVSRSKMVQLFATILTPNNGFQADYCFTSFITHIGLLKAELLPLMYLLLSPNEETGMEVLHYNALFFKSLWQLELVSMKFESLLSAFQNHQHATLVGMEQTYSNSEKAAGESIRSQAAARFAAVEKAQNDWKEKEKAKRASMGDTSSVIEDDLPTSPLPEFEPTCRLCCVSGPAHPSHRSHASQTLPSSFTPPPLPREPVLSLCFVTEPKACPTPVSAFSNSPPPPGVNPPPSPTKSTSPLLPGQVPADSPLAWVNLRENQFLEWLRTQGRAVQLLDVVDIDWSSGIVTAWMNRGYVNYVRKCSSFAQVCIVDFEAMRVVAPPRSVVHLKTLRSMNIR